MRSNGPPVGLGPASLDPFRASSCRRGSRAFNTSIEPCASVTVPVTLLCARFLRATWMAPESMSIA